ncbi:MAG: hypothetical protein ACLRZ4_12645 [Eubacterium ramulus]
MNACGGWNSLYWSNHDQARALPALVMNDRNIV